jgi:aspartate-semialdehyde dehydrogenase
MSGGNRIRIAIVGATGTLGSELVALMDQELLPIAELRLYAGEHSLGRSLEFQGDEIRIETESPSLVGLDLVLLCTPAAVSLELIRSALRSEVPCLDCSGALVGSSDVPMVIADLGAHDQVMGAPLITMPVGPALSWAPVLSAIQRGAELTRVVGTVLQSASSQGRGGIESLSEQTVGLLNQSPRHDLQTPAGPAAFDSLPGAADESEAGKDGASSVEAGLVMALRRLLGPDVGLAVTNVMVPAFAGEGSVLAIETDRPMAVDEAAQRLAAAPGVDVWNGEAAPSTREAVGRDEVLVGRLRADETSVDGAGGLLLWLAADPVRLAASNAVKLLRTRLALG